LQPVGFLGQVVQRLAIFLYGTVPLADEAQDSLHDGQRRTQLVGGICSELALAGKATFDARQHRIEGVGKAADLIAVIRQVQAGRQVLGRDTVSRAGDLVNRR